MVASPVTARPRTGLFWTLSASRTAGSPNTGMSSRTKLRAQRRSAACRCLAIVFPTSDECDGDPSVKRGNSHIHEPHNNLPEVLRRVLQLEDQVACFKA